METKTQVHLELVGLDGNAFSILGRAKTALDRAGQSDLWDQFHTEATSGDYSHLLITCMKWFICDEFNNNDEYEDEDEDY